MENQSAVSDVDAITTARNDSTSASGNFRKLSSDVDMKGGGGSPMRDKSPQRRSRSASGSFRGAYESEEEIHFAGLAATRSRRGHHQRDSNHSSISGKL